MKEKLKKEQRETRRKQANGITLIALVITIIVLLILAGVSIAMLTGENGILTQAQNASKQTEIAEEKEQIALAYNGAVTEKQSTDITADDLKEQFEANGVDNVTVTGENPIKVTFTEEDGTTRTYTIDANGKITEEGSGTTPPTTGTVESGKYYEEDTDVKVGDKTITIPGGATVSGIDEENNSVDDGFVIYITKGETVDWSNPEAVQEKYDQFVWVPVKDALAVDMDNSGTIDQSDINAMVAAGRYPMAIKISDNEYKGILYNFTEGTNGVTITPYDYNATSSSSPSYREPDVVSYDTGDYKNEGVTKAGLQAEFKEMVEGVAEKGGFWVGRYETSSMSTDTAKDTSTSDFIKVVKGTTDGINNVKWYRMYAQQKNYKNSLKQSKNTKSSMMWGSQWDQIMIWMKDIKNGDNYYITNSVGRGNFGNGDEYTDTSNPTATGCFEVKNIYDLAGNVYDWTLEAGSAFGRVVRRRLLR